LKSSTNLESRPKTKPAISAYFWESLYLEVNHMLNLWLIMTAMTTPRMCSSPRCFPQIPQPRQRFRSSLLSTQKQHLNLPPPHYLERRLARAALGQQRRLRSRLPACRIRRRRRCSRPHHQWRLRRREAVPAPRCRHRHLLHLEQARHLRPRTTRTMLKTMVGRCLRRC